MTVKTTIERAGQKYVDHEIKVMPKIEAGSIADAVAHAFGVATPRRAPIVVGHERVQLNWKKPLRGPDGEFVRNADGSIKLVPR